MVHLAIAKPFDQKRIELVHLYKKGESPNKSSSKELEDANIEIATNVHPFPYRIYESRRSFGIPSIPPIVEARYR